MLEKLLEPYFQEIQNIFFRSIVEKMLLNGVRDTAVIFLKRFNGNNFADGFLILLCQRVAAHAVCGLLEGDGQAFSDVRAAGNNKPGQNHSDKDGCGQSTEQEDFLSGISVGKTGSSQKNCQWDRNNKGGTVAHERGQNTGEEKDAGSDFIGIEAVVMELIV